MENKADPFSFHTGNEYEQHGEQHIGTCPFCEKTQKFYFNDDFLWDCKNANCIDKEGKRRSGNVISFLRQMYEEHDTLTKGSSMVATMRSLPGAKVITNGIKLNLWNDTIIIPTYRNGKINNIYKCVNVDGKVMILCTPGVEHTIMNWPEETFDTVWVAEGHWDKIAGEAIVGSNQITVIGAPGAGVWKKNWTDILADKHVVFCYDNDNAGRTGMERIILKHIAPNPQKPKSISYIKWPEGTREKYDLNDTYKEHQRESFKWLSSNIVPYSVPEGTVIVKTTIETVQANKDIDTFDKLLNEFSQLYHTTRDMEYCLALVLASIYSVNIGGEQIWLRIIGPPGCGKTTIASAVGSSEQVVLKSTFTGLFSGFKDDSDEDASLVPTISGKTLIVKDADALLRQPNIERIFSELRDFYDKNSSTQYRNRIQHDYRNIRSTMILCGTNILRRSDQSFLGERFLDFELHVTKTDEELIMDRMMSRSQLEALNPSTLPPETPVQAAAKGFIEHLMEKPMTGLLKDDTLRTIKKLAKLTALMRTKVDRDMFGRGDITFSPVSEIPTRLIGQFGKLRLCLPMVFGVDDYRSDAILKKVTRDIIDPTSNRYKLCMDLMEGWFSRDGLVESSKLTKTVVSRELDNLRELNIVRDRVATGSAPGRKRLEFTLQNEITEGLTMLEAR